MTLDEAWAAAEAVLPEGWWLQLDHGVEPAYRVQAGPGVWSPEYEAVVVAGPTPTAALQALATRLQDSTR